VSGADRRDHLRLRNDLAPPTFHLHPRAIFNAVLTRKRGVDLDGTVPGTCRRGADSPVTVPLRYWLTTRPVNGMTGYSSSGSSALNR